MSMWTLVKALIVKDILSFAMSIGVLVVFIAMGIIYVVISDWREKRHGNK